MLTGSLGVKDCLKATLRKDAYPGRMPSVIFYDNACSLLEHLIAQHDNYFADVILAVDVFHAVNKHSAGDIFCLTHCNPALFPELKSGNQWRFNSSAAEQVNKWFGAFQAITRGMGMVRYVNYAFPV